MKNNHGRIEKFSKEIEELEEEVKAIEAEIAGIEGEYENQKEEEQKLHLEEVNEIKKKNLKLKEILEKRLKGEA